MIGRRSAGDNDVTHKTFVYLMYGISQMLFTSVVHPLPRGGCQCRDMEEYIGVEPTPPAWRAGVLTTIQILHGAPDRNRTCNLLITRQLLCLLSYRSMMAVRILPLLWKRIGEAFCERFGDLCGNRTHVTAVKGPCLNRLTNRPYKNRLLPVCYGRMQPFALHIPSYRKNVAVTFGRLARR